MANRNMHSGIRIIGIETDNVRVLFCTILR